MTQLSSLQSSSISRQVIGDNPAPGATHPHAAVDARVAEFADLSPTPSGPTMGSLDHLLNVTVTVTAELGRVRRPIGDVLKYGKGAVVELDHLTSEPVDVLIQGVRVARGEVVVVGDRFAVRITEIVESKKRS